WLLDAGKPATVNHPNLLTVGGRGGIVAADGCSLQFSKPSIEPGKIKGRAYPQNSGEHMRPPQDQICPFLCVKSHSKDPTSGQLSNQTSARRGPTWKINRCPASKKSKPHHSSRSSARI